MVYREIKPRQLFHLFYRAAETTAVIMFLVSAAGVSAWLITTANIPQQLADLVQPLMDNKMLLTFALMVLVLLMGTALDFTPTVLIMTPVLMPVLKQAGIDPVYFGVLFIMNNAIGLVTPPVGHGAQRGVRRGQDPDERRDQGRHAVHGRADHRHAAAGGLSADRDVAAGNG